MNKTKYSSIVDDDLCLLACDTILEKYWLWSDEAQQRLYDLVIKGCSPQSKDSKTMLCAAFWLTRFLLFSFLRKEQINEEDTN